MPDKIEGSVRLGPDMMYKLEKLCEVMKLSKTAFLRQGILSRKTEKPKRKGSNLCLKFNKEVDKILEEKYKKLGITKSEWVKQYIAYIWWCYFDYEKEYFDSFLM
ncbi:MAG: hypothetical protein ABSG94_12215 [Brevinematales bacterium]|jgi:hypothetical protein